MSGGQALSAPRGSFFKIFPGDTEIVIQPAPKGHPLFDGRALVDPPESFVNNMAALGNLEPILVVKASDQPGSQVVYIVDGRKRYRGWQLANELCKKMGAPPFPLKVIVQQGACDEKSCAPNLIAMMGAANVHIDETPVNLAGKLASMVNASDIEHAALFYGLTEHSVEQHLELIKISQLLKDAVDTGRVSITAALELNKLPPEDQKGALEVGAVLEDLATASGQKPGKKKQISVKQAKRMAGGGHKKKSDKPTVAELREALVHLQDVSGLFALGALAALVWATDGELSETLAEAMASKKVRKTG